MTMADSMLSQAEIDRILNGGEQDNANGNMTNDVSEIRAYDPNTQRRVIRERLESLEIINERFARQFRIGLFNLLRRTADVTVKNIKIVPYHEFARNLPIPTNLNLVHMNPLRGTALFVFSPNFVFSAVDTLFGGDGRFLTKVEGREFTPTEQRIIKRILQMALDTYSEAWKTIYPLNIEYVRAETQVKFTNITASPNDIVVITPFVVDAGTQISEFDICIPFSMIEPLRELLTNPPKENSKQEDNQWRNRLASQMKDSELELIANLAHLPVRLSKVMKLKKGDIIPIDKPENTVATVDNVPVLVGKYGNLNGQYALQVERLINPVLNSMNNEDLPHE